MKLYLVINILIILFPLILSFDKRVKYYKNFIPVMLSIIIVGVIFLTWDSIAVSRGDWAFNEEYVTESNFVNLPYEEILFFITVPYSILFIYECFKHYLKDKTYTVNKAIPIIIVLTFLIMGIICYHKHYTSTVFIFSGIIIFLGFIFMREIILSKVFFLTVLVSYIPFFVVNYILTSIPVVIYNPAAILGIRVLSIPVEDFLYSFSMIFCWILVYSLIKKRISKFKIA